MEFVDLIGTVTLLTVLAAVMRRYERRPHPATFIVAALLSCVLVTALLLSGTVAGSALMSTAMVALGVYAIIALGSALLACLASFRHRGFWPTFYAAHHLSFGLFVGFMIYGQIG
jgi:hypothetical protein